MKISLKYSKVYPLYREWSEGESVEINETNVPQNKSMCDFVWGWQQSSRIEEKTKL